MLDLTKDQRTIASQREHIDELEETVRQLREAISPSLLFPAEWRLSPIRAKLLQTLVAADTALSHHQLYVSVACHGDVDPARLMSVHICHLRKHLSKLGIPVEIWTRHGHGYELPPASKVIIKEALKRRTAS